MESVVQESPLAPESASISEGERSAISRAAQRSLRVQRVLGWVCLLPVYLLISALIHLKFRYKVRNHWLIRKRFRALTREDFPLIICSNHLTLVDSIILLWALGSPLDFLLHFRLFAWNVPAIENYKSKPTWRLLTYLGKCIPVDRFGSREHLDSVLELLAYLLRQGDLCMLFPEGTRSRTGRINPAAVTYGVGKLIRKVPESRVLCVYLRGQGQSSYSDFPKVGEIFHVEMELLHPTSSHHGLRAVRDYSTQTIQKLKAMEDAFLGGL